MATTGNHHNGNNQPRRKRNKKPVKRYSEEYSNRPNPYTGYSADGNYHPEAMKQHGSGSAKPEHARTSEGRISDSRTAEEARQASFNAALAEAAWGPAHAAQPAQPAPAPQPSGFVPPTVTVPPPKWSVSNNLTRQQLAAQEAAQAAAVQPNATTGSDTPKPAEAAPEDSAPDGGNVGTPSPTPHSGGSRRRRNHRSKEETARERAAKIEAKRAAVDKIAQGVAAHSVSEQMIDDISSMSDVIETMPKQPKPSAETGVNWEEFYDAAFPPKAADSAKFAGKRAKQPKKRMDFKEDASADAPMIVKPVMLGDDDLLPYDKIARENAQEEAEAKAAKAAREAAAKEKSSAAAFAIEAKARADSKAAEEKAAEEKAAAETAAAAEKAAAEKAAAETAAAEEAKPSTPAEAQPRADVPAEAAKDPYLDLLPELEIPEPENTAEDTLEDIANLADAVSIEEILATVEKQKQESVRRAETIQSGTEFAVRPAFSFDAETDESWNEDIPFRAASDIAEPQPVVLPVPEEAPLSDLPSGASQAPEEDGIDEAIEAVDLTRFLAESKPEPAVEYAVPSPAEESASDAREETTAASVPEDIFDTAEPVRTNPPEEKKTQAKAQPVFVEEESRIPEVEVIIADLEDDIFAEETVAVPEEPVTEEPEEESGIDVEDKIEKLAEAAEVAEIFRMENEDLLSESVEDAIGPDIFSVSIDDIAVIPEARPEARPSDEEEIKQYQPHRKKRESDDNIFESVLIVDENPRMIDAAASAGQDETQFLHSREQTENPTAVFKLPDGPIVFPTDIDDAEFQEQWLDEDEDGDDMASRNKRTRRRISAFIGAVALLFAVMILFSAVRTVVSGFTNIGSTSEKKTEYTEFISPVVVNDPMPFESIDKADNNMLLKSSIWQALNELDETEGYEHVSDATNKIVLPAEMVEKAARELFGKDVKLNMNVLSEYDGSAIYYYDSIDNSFHITRSGITGPSAIITKIAQKSDHISLVVGYISEEEMSLTSSESTEEECYKFMEYILGLNSNGSYYIKSIRNYVDD